MRIPSSARSIASFAPPSNTQNTAPVIEYRCIYTKDLRKKAKRYQDGFVRFHTFNRKFMVYDDSGVFVAEHHWPMHNDIDAHGLEGEEFQAFKGLALVEIQEKKLVTEVDLADVIKQRGKARPNEPSPHRPSTQRPSLGHPNASLKTVLTGPASVHARSPFESRQAQLANENARQILPKKRRTDDEHLPLWQILKTTRPAKRPIHTSQTGCRSQPRPASVMPGQTTLSCLETIDLSSQPSSESSPRHNSGPQSVAAGPQPTENKTHAVSEASEPTPVSGWMQRLGSNGAPKHVSRTKRKREELLLDDVSPARNAAQSRGISPVDQRQANDHSQHQPPRKMRRSRAHPIGNADETQQLEPESPAPESPAPSSKTKPKKPRRKQPRSTSPSAAGDASTMYDGRRTSPSVNSKSTLDLPNAKSKKNALQAKSTKPLKLAAKAPRNKLMCLDLDDVVDAPPKKRSRPHDMTVPQVQSAASISKPGSSPVPIEDARKAPDPVHDAGRLDHAPSNEAEDNSSFQGTVRYQLYRRRMIKYSQPYRDRDAQGVSPEIIEPFASDEIEQESPCTTPQPVHLGSASKSTQVPPTGPPSPFPDMTPSDFADLDRLLLLPQGQPLLIDGNVNAMPDVSHNTDPTLPLSATGQATKALECTTLRPPSPPDVPVDVVHVASGNEDYLPSRSTLKPISQAKMSDAPQLEAESIPNKRTKSALQGGTPQQEPSTTETPGPEALCKRSEPVKPVKTEYRANTKIAPRQDTSAMESAAFAHPAAAMTAPQAATDMPPSDHEAAPTRPAAPTDTRAPKPPDKAVPRVHRPFRRVQSDTSPPKQASARRAPLRRTESVTVAPEPRAPPPAPLEPDEPATGPWSVEAWDLFGPSQCPAGFIEKLGWQKYASDARDNGAVSARPGDGGGGVLSKMGGFVSGNSIGIGVGW